MSPAPSDHPKLQEQDRAAFEAWAKDEWFPMETCEPRGDDTIGEYRDVRTASAWLGWKSAIAKDRRRILAALPPAGYVDAADVRRVVEGER